MQGHISKKTSSGGKEEMIDLFEMEQEEEQEQEQEQEYAWELQAGIYDPPSW